MLTTEVENYPGFVDGILGPELMGRFRDQAARFGASFSTRKATRVALDASPFGVWTGATEGEPDLLARVLIVATGARSIMLGVPGEARLLGHGVMLEDQRGVSSPPMDIGICGQNMVLAAHSMGAATCWIGLIKLLMYDPKWKKFFGVKYPYKLNVCIAVGWPKVDSDGQVPREVQLVQWYEGGMDDAPRIEKQGE